CKAFHRNPFERNHGQDTRRRREEELKRQMRSKAKLKFAVLMLLLVAVAAFVTACRGSKANVRKEEATANTPPAVEVTTAAAIKRDLPRFFEATGSLAGDQQTDVAPQTSGKVVA